MKAHVAARFAVGDAALDDQPAHVSRRVPSRSAASSNVISLSILTILLLLCGGHGAKFLAGHRSLFAGAGGG
jgi:hypothetical protein